MSNFNSISRKYFAELPKVDEGLQKDLVKLFYALERDGSEGMTNQEWAAAHWHVLSLVFNTEEYLNLTDNGNKLLSVEETRQFFFRKLTEMTKDTSAEPGVNWLLHGGGSGEFKRAVAEADESAKRALASAPRPADASSDAASDAASDAGSDDASPETNEDAASESGKTEPAPENESENANDAATEAAETAEKLPQGKMSEAAKEQVAMGADLVAKASVDPAMMAMLEELKKQLEEIKEGMRKPSEAEVALARQVRILNEETGLGLDPNINERDAFDWLYNKVTSLLKFTNTVVGGTKDFGKAVKASVYGMPETTWKSWMISLAPAPVIMAYLLFTEHAYPTWAKAREARALSER